MATPAPNPNADIYSQYGPYANDPGFLAALNQAHAQDAQASALLNQLTQNAQYQYNGQGNPYSITAGLGQQHEDATRSYLNSLAARGLIRSGDTGYDAGQEAKRYGQSLYTAQQALQAALNGYQQNYLATQNTDASNVATALQQAHTNYQNQLATGNPGSYGYWNNGQLPAGIPGYVQVNPASAAQNQTTGGSLIASGLFK